jgi:hypothetical protein
MRSKTSKTSKTSKKSKMDRGSKRKMSEKREIDELIKDNIGIIGVDSGLKEAINNADKAMEEFSLDLYESMIDKAKQSLSPEQLELAEVKQSMYKLNKTAQKVSESLQRPLVSSRNKSSSVRSKRSKKELEELKELKEKIMSENKLLMNEIFYLIDNWVSDPSNKGKNPNSLKIYRNKKQIIDNCLSIYPRNKENYTLISKKLDKFINAKIMSTKEKRKSPSLGARKKTKKRKNSHKLKKKKII